MPGPYLLDTNVLMAYARGKGPVFDAVEQTYSLLNPQTASYVSVVSIGEILSFARRRSWSKKLADLQLLTSKLVTVEILHQQPLMDAYAEIDSFTLGLKPSRTMGKNDLWIAATAKVTKAILLTTDPDFEHLERVHLTRHKIDEKTGAITKA
jgi:predicted nucleic acid-binding protein